MKKILSTLSFWGSIASISGLSIYQLFQTKLNIVVPTIFIKLAIIILIFTCIYYYYQLSKLKHKIINNDKRKKIVRNYLTHVLREVKIFAGDLSWVSSEIDIISELLNRGVKVSILIDNDSNRTNIQHCKLAGVDIRKYCDDMNAPIKGLLIDTDEQTEAKGYIIKRTTRTDRLAQEKYRYLFKGYDGDDDYQIIKALDSLFDSLFQKAVKIEV